MNNIIFFPRKKAATVPARIAGRNEVRTALVAVWQRNAGNGRLECHWIVEQAPSHDEGLRFVPDRHVA